MNNCDCSTQDNSKCAHDGKKNKQHFFKPNNENINNFKSAKVHKKRQSFSINLLLFALAVSITFFTFHDALVFVAIVGVILLLASAKTHLNSQQYHSLCDTKTVSGEHQCIFCGNHGIYRSSPNHTNITECRCSKCKEHLFNE